MFSDLATSICSFVLMSLCQISRPVQLSTPAWRLFLIPLFEISLSYFVFPSSSTCFYEVFLIVMFLQILAQYRHLYVWSELDQYTTDIIHWTMGYGNIMLYHVKSRFPLVKNNWLSIGYFTWFNPIFSSIIELYIISFFWKWIFTV